MNIPFSPILKLKTVDSVMSSFRHAVAELEKIREANLDKAEVLESEMEEIEMEAKLAREEAARASRAMQNINSLLIGL